MADLSISLSIAHCFIVIFGVFVRITITDGRYEDMALFKGDKYMIINSHTGGKTVRTVTKLDYPLNETGTLDAACSIDKNYFFFKGDKFWRITAKQNSDGNSEHSTNSAHISSLFNTTFSSGVSAALCSLEIKDFGSPVMQVAYLFKDKSVEKLGRLNGSSAVFQVMRRANLTFAPDAGVAIKISSYGTPFYYPVVSSKADLFLLNMDYPNQMTSFGKLKRNLKLRSDEEMFFSSNLSAAMSLLPSDSFLRG